MTLRTHYRNLRVSRDAPPEVIKAAYKALSSRWHPDRHPGNPAATQIMAILNTAYAVLSDPARREEHDRWILLQEIREKQGMIPPPSGAGARFDRYAQDDRRSECAPPVPVPTGEPAEEPGLRRHFWDALALIVILVAGIFTLR